MTTAAHDTLQVRGLGREKIRQLTRKAKHLGTTPEDYVKQLVEEDLAVSQEARTKTFAEIMGPGQAVDEEEVDRIVERIRSRNYEQSKKQRR